MTLDVVAVSMSPAFTHRGAAALLAVRVSLRATGPRRLALAAGSSAACPPSQPPPPRRQLVSGLFTKAELGPAQPRVLGRGLQSLSLEAVALGVAAQ